MDEVHENLRFCVSERPVDIRHMYQEVPHKVRNVVITHENDDLLSRRTLCGHLNARFRFGVAFNYIVDLIDFFSINREECFLDLDDLRCTDVLF